MFGRKRTGSVLCTSCGVLVGVNDDKCYNCGRRNPALWGFAPVLRSLGNDLGFTPFVFGLCTLMFALTIIGSSGLTAGGGLFGLLAPDGRILYLFGALGAGPVFDRGRWWTVLSASCMARHPKSITMGAASLRICPIPSQQHAITR